MARKRFDAIACLCALAALGLSAGPIRAQVVIDETFDGADLTCPAGWTCNPVFDETTAPNAPVIISNAMDLTPAVGDLAASVFHTTPHNIQTNRFQAKFQIEIVGDADGMTFAVIDAAAGAEYLGGAGGGLGWAGTVQGFAVEFDIWNNEAPADPDRTVDEGNHVGVNLNGSVNSVATSAEGPSSGVDFCVPGGRVILEIGATYNVQVDFDNGRITVWLQGGGFLNSTQVLTTTIGPFPSSQALFGFTAGTGGATANHRVDNFTLELFPDVSDPAAPAVAGPVPSLFAVNCGSAARVAGDGASFEPDQRWVDGKTSYGWYGSFGEDLPDGGGNHACQDALLSLRVPADPPGLEAMYDSLRFGPANANFGYRFLVEPGTYEITLYFNESSGFYGSLDIEGALLLLPLCYGADLELGGVTGSTGLRRMDIVVEGVKQLENFSLIDLPTAQYPHLAGVRDGPVTIRTAQRPGYATLEPVTVLDGTLDLDFLLHDTGVVEDLAGPAISGIKLVRIGDAGDDPVPSVVVDADTLTIQDGRTVPGAGVYDGTRDTTIQEQRPDRNNGKAEHIELGRTADDADLIGDPDDDRSILLRFGGLADIVSSTMAGRELVSATLRLDYFSSRPGNDEDIGYQGNGGDYLDGGHCPALTVQRADLIPPCAGTGLPPSIPFNNPALDQNAFCAGTDKAFTIHQLLTMWDEGFASDETDGAVEPAGGTGATWDGPLGAGSASWAGASRPEDFVADPIATIVLTDPTQMSLGAANPAGAGFTSVVPSIFDASVGLIPLPSYMPVEIDVTDVARAWIAGNLNPGLLIRDDPNSRIAEPFTDRVNELKGTRTLKSREWPSIVDRPSLTLVFTAGGPAPELVQVAGGLGASPNEFISPHSENAPFTSISLEASEAVTVTSAAVESTDGTARTATLSAGDAGGLHTLTIDPAVPVGGQVRVTLQVESAAGGVATFVVLLGHMPGDINQDGTVGISDVGQFGVQWRMIPQPAIMVDHNGDGTISASDPGGYGATFSGFLGSQQWNGLTMDSVQ